MLKKSVKETIFFLAMFVLFFLIVKLAHYLGKNEQSDMLTLVYGGLYVIVMAGVYFLSGLGSNKEGFWDVSLLSQMKGGEYMFQGQSPIAQEYRALNSTPEGKCLIKTQNCDKGFIGVPSLPFLYTPLSNDKWENERCQDRPTCDCQTTQAMENES